MRTSWTLAFRKSIGQVDYFEARQVAMDECACNFMP